MKRLRKFLVIAFVAALIVVMFTCVCAADSFTGFFRVYDRVEKRQVCNISFNTGEDLNDLFDSWTSKDYDIYVELNADLNMGGSSGDPLLIDGKANVDFNLKGHTVYRDFAESKYYGDGNVMEISPGRDEAQIWIYSDECSDGTKDHPTATPGAISGGQNDDEGGGIYFDDGGRVHLKNVSVCNNKTYEQGGGIFVNDASMIVYLEEGASICDNFAYDYGGGVYLFWGRLEMNGGLIARNRANGCGGGVYVCGGLWDAEFEMSGGCIADNEIKNIGEEAYGAGIYSDGDLDIYGGSISGNIITNWRPERYSCEKMNGGGIYIGSGDHNNISNANISNNVAAGYGGGICYDGGDELDVHTSVIENNTAHSGGGVFINAEARFEHCRIRDNSATFDDGGGIYNCDDLHLVDTEVTGNTAVKTGGGIYGLNYIYLTECTITDNRAKTAGGVFVYADYDITAISWCKIYRNFTYDHANSNLYLDAAPMSSAFLDPTGIESYYRTSIYVTAEKVHGGHKRISKKLCANAEDNEKLCGCIWYDESGWEIVAESNGINGAPATTDNCYVYLLEEYATDTAGTLATRSIGTITYPKGTTLFAGSRLGADIENVSYLAIYDDNPQNGLDGRKSAVIPRNSSYEPIFGLYYRDVHVDGYKKANLTDNYIELDCDWILNRDIYLCIRSSRYVTSVLVDIPELRIGDPMPDTARITAINGVSIAGFEKPVSIEWENGTVLVEPGIAYRGTVHLPYDFYDKTAGGFTYHDCYFRTECSATLGGRPMDDVTTSTGWNEYLLSFTIETAKPWLTEIEWPKPAVISAKTGYYVSDYDLPEKIPAYAVYEDANGEPMEIFMLLDAAEPAYTEAEAASKAALTVNNLYTGRDFFAFPGTYSYSYSPVVPDGIDTSLYLEAGRSLSKSYTVNVTGDEAEYYDGVPVPEIQIADVDLENGTVSYYFSRQLGYDVYECHYAVGSSAPELELLDSTPVALSIDPATLAACRLSHQPCTALFCVSAKSVESAIGFDVNESEVRTWYIQVEYVPDSYILTVNGKVDSTLFPGNTWTCEAAEYEYNPGDNVLAAAIPRTGGRIDSNMKFLRWEIDGNDIITEETKLNKLINLTMPANNAAITAVYAPMVTGVSITIPNNPELATASAVMTGPGGYSVTKTAAIEWAENEGIYTAAIILTESTPEALYFSARVGVTINGTAVEAVQGNTVQDIGFLAAEYTFPLPPPVDPVYTAPTARTLLYEYGVGQRLLDAGKTNDGIFMYGLGTATGPSIAVEEFISEIYIAEEPGTYYVWYYVLGDELHNNSELQVVAATIGEATGIVNARIEDGIASFDVVNRSKSARANAAVVYYLGGQTVHVDFREISLTEGYEQAAYDGDFDSCKAFIFTGAYTPFGDSGSFKIRSAE